MIFSLKNGRNSLNGAHNEQLVVGTERENCQLSSVLKSQIEK